MSRLSEHRLFTKLLTRRLISGVPYQGLDRDRASDERQSLPIFSRRDVRVGSIMSLRKCDEHFRFLPP